MSDSIAIAPGAADDAADRRRRIFAIVGSSSGNLVEWYDFYCYAFFALYFAPAFFPSGDTTSQLLQSAGVFAVGFSCGRSEAGCSAASPIGSAAVPPW